MSSIATGSGPDECESTSGKSGGSGTVSAGATCYWYIHIHTIHLILYTYISRMYV